MKDLRGVLDPRILDGCLKCPVCGAGMGVAGDGRSVLCRGARAHCFDAGAGGYLPLSPRHPGGGDTKDAVRARSDFLGAGYYAPAAGRLCGLASSLCPSGGLLLDAGCGEGYYSNRLCGCGFSVLGVDLSKFAVDAAARSAARIASAAGDGTGDALPRTLYAVGSVFELPVRDGCFDLVTNVFAPCAPAEYARVLKPGGRLIVAGAGERHLMGLKRVLYDDPYVNEGRRDLPASDDPSLTLEARDNITFTITVRTQAHIAALFSMTPYYWRTSPDSRSRLDGLEDLETEVSFDFFIYRKAN